MLSNMISYKEHSYKEFAKRRFINQAIDRVSLEAGFHNDLSFFIELYGLIIIWDYYRDYLKTVLSNFH